MYVAFKVVHLFAVVAFLGNISVGLFWKRIADRTGDAKIIAHTINGIIKSDRLITLPSIVIIIAAGIFAAGEAHFPLLRTGWILWSLILFTISGIAFVPLSAVQLQLAAVAETGMGNADQRGAYLALSHRWDFWGFVALGAPLAILVLMIAKPALPAITR